MIIKEIVKEPTTKVVDVTCDICGKSCNTEYDAEYMSLKACWGYMSGKDLEIWEAQVCESCVDEHLKMIKFLKRNSVGGRVLE